MFRQERQQQRGYNLSCEQRVLGPSSTPTMEEAFRCSAVEVGAVQWVSRHDDLIAGDDDRFPDRIRLERGTREDNDGATRHLPHGYHFLAIFGIACTFFDGVEQIQGQTRKVRWRQTLGMTILRGSAVWQREACSCL